MAIEKLGKQRVFCGWCFSLNWKNVGTEWSGHAILVCKDCANKWVETNIFNSSSQFLKGIKDKKKIDRIMLRISQGWPDISPEEYV